MIIGGNNNFNNQNNNFQNKFNDINKQNKKNQIKNTFVDDITIQKHSNPTNKHDMSDKALAMLHERYSQGLISLEEFNKKCNILGQKRQK